MSTFETHLLRFSFFISVISTAGSLFFSEVLKLPPCSLCWYQRICMYPLVYIFGLGLLRENREWIYHSAGLIFAGLGIAIFHNLLYFGVIPESITPCTGGIPCSARLIEWFGWISIPQLSLFSFLLLTLTWIFAIRSKGIQK